MNCNSGDLFVWKLTVATSGDICDLVTPSNVDTNCVIPGITTLPQILPDFLSSIVA